MKKNLQDKLLIEAPPVSIKDIARRCGVHYVTVSRALCGDVRVKPKTSEHILAIAREMQYDFNSGYAGSRLAALRHRTKVISHVIGIYFPQHVVRYPYFAEMFEGIMTETTNSGYTLHLIPTIDPEVPTNDLSSLPTPLKRGDLDGIIFTPTSHSDRILRQLREEPHFGNRPIVALMNELEGCSSVRTNDYLGMSALMQHLLDLGHRHFKHSHWMDPILTDTSTQRHLAMRDSCLAYGLDPEQCLHFEALDWDQPLHYRMELPIQNALKKHPEVTAIIAPNDFYAVQAYDVLRRNGVRVPEDISLVGFDDISPIPGDGGNILTTVHLPLEQVGREAAKHLIAAIEGRCDEPRQIVLPSGPVVVRKTTGPASVR